MRARTRDILSQLRNGGLLALVTVLIWLLAESESLRVDRTRVDLTFRAEPETGRYIRVDPDFPGSVAVRLEGSTARVDDLMSRLRKPLRLEPGMEGIPQEPGRHMIDLRTVLRDLPQVRESGASIAEVDPSIVGVTVDNLVTREAKVRVELPPGLALEGPPEATPATVRIRMPEALAASLPAELQVVAPIDEATVSNLPEGRRSQVRDLRLEPPEVLRGAEGVRILPPTSSLALTLRSRTTMHVLSTVPVHVRLAPTETGMWDIMMPAESRILNDVTVSGPTHEIDAIRRNEVKPIAYVTLSFDELERAADSNTPLQKEPIFCDLPTQLRFEVKPSQKLVQLVVKRRSQPPAPANPPVVTPNNAPGAGSPPGTGR